MHVVVVGAASSARPPRITWPCTAVDAGRATSVSADILNATSRGPGSAHWAKSQAGDWRRGFGLRLSSAGLTSRRVW